uniref:Putative ixodes 10 kDa peptide protein n=1 Tax=Ixodes ricinus TaxID=34613 RepID=A0A0K8RN46_IXORI
MYRIISNMLLVLFAVALGLPASKGKESSNSLMECYRAVKNGGDILCQLRGYGSKSCETIQKLIYFFIIQMIFLFL